MFTITRVDSNAAQDDMLTEQQVVEGRSDVILKKEVCFSPQDIIEKCQDADVLTTHFASISREVFEKLPRCKAVVRYGVGYDTIDVQAASDNGVYVINVPDFCTEEVSNHVIMFMLCACKKLITLNDLTKSGQWECAKQFQKPMGCIYGETIGIIGCGNLGKAVAKKANAFHMKVIGYDPYIAPYQLEKVGIVPAELDEVLQQSDYVTLHVAQTDETYHLINEKTLSKMKPNAVLINCSRGPIIDEAALTKALKEKKIYMACLDVFEKEPLDIGNELLSLNQVIVTPHDASYSDYAFWQLKTSVMKEALRILEGKKPLHIVNKSGNVKWRADEENEG